MSHNSKYYIKKIKLDDAKLVKPIYTYFSNNTVTESETQPSTCTSDAECQNTCSRSESQPTTTSDAECSFAPDKNISTCSESENKEPEDSAILCVSKSKITSDEDSSDSDSEDDECPSVVSSDKRLFNYKKI